MSIVDQQADITTLTKVVSEGIASESDTGIALRAIQTTLGVGLVSTLNETSNGFQRLNNLLTRCIDKYVTTAEALLDTDSIDQEQLFEIITAIQKNQIAYMELYRKIVQSPNKIFSDDLLSAEERKLLTLLKSFKTPEEKVLFLKAVESALSNNQNNEFE
jgi:hypothetical protein